MTNTYMLAGEHDPQEIIASRSRRACTPTNFGGGQVDITSGKFVFSCQRGLPGSRTARCTYPVKGATLIGNGPDALNQVSMIGNDLDARHRRRHLRQGRPERAGRRRPADAAHRRPDGGRHGLSRAAASCLPDCRVCQKTVRASCATLIPMKAARLLLCLLLVLTRLRRQRELSTAQRPSPPQQPSEAPAVFFYLVTHTLSGVDDQAPPPATDVGPPPRRPHQPYRRPAHPGHHRAAAARAPDPLLPDRVAPRPKS